LIATGSHLNNKTEPGSLDVLLTQISLLDQKYYRTPFQDFDHMQLIAELVELIVRNGGRLQQYSRQGVMAVLRMSARMTSICPSMPSTYYHFLTPDKYYKLMENLGSIFRCIFLSNPSAIVTDITSSVESFDFPQFIDAFIAQANYPPTPDRSNRLLQVVLDVISATDLNALKSSLALRLSYLTGSALSSSRTANAVEWARGVDAPLRLQHLARREILNAMSHRSLQGSASLGLPSQLLQYVLFKTD